MLSFRNVKSVVYVSLFFILCITIVISQTSISSPHSLTEQENENPASFDVQSTGIPTAQSKILFGLGPEADKALTSPIASDFKIKILTSWYNGPHDLPWITEWKTKFIPSLYEKGYALHLITYTDFPEKNYISNYGAVCGREYPLSDRFLGDMKLLATTFSGKGELYVSLFTEFQTYPCVDNTWYGNENYYNGIKSQYRKAKTIFHEYAPNAKVSISWGGWQGNWDDTASMSGRSLIKEFSDILEESDFTAFQAMDSYTNLNDIITMTKILGAYKKPVMLTHYKPDNGDQTVFEKDVRSLFTDKTISTLTEHGLFAMSFMDSNNLSSNENIYEFIRSAINKYSL